MADLLWSWALTIVGATCFYLAGGLNGRKVWWVWYIGLFAQVLWFTYAVLDIEHRMGFLVGVALYGFVYVRNCINWTCEHRAEKREEAKLDVLIRQISKQLDVPYEILRPRRRRWARWRIGAAGPEAVVPLRRPEPPTVGPESEAGDSGARP